MCVREKGRRKSKKEGMCVPETTCAFAFDVARVALLALRLKAG